jgi:hypothetical protein
MRQMEYPFKCQTSQQVWEHRGTKKDNPTVQKCRLLGYLCRLPLVEALRSSETDLLTRVTQHNIPEDGILHSHRYKLTKSYIALIARGSITELCSM